MASEKWYQDGLKFSCTRCGACCSGDPGYVWVTQEDVKRIAEFLGYENGRLEKTEIRRVGFRHSLTERANGDCIYLERYEDGLTGCKIHPVRPLQCRTWPFWPENLRSPGSWERSAAKCPGMNRGEHFNFVSIEALRTKKDV